MGGHQPTSGPGSSEHAAGAPLSLRGLSRRYEPLVAFGAEHVLEGFECRSEQTNWLRRYVRQFAGAGATRVLVVTENGAARVVAYGAWLILLARPPRLGPQRGQRVLSRWPC
jgi:hypothetical protein